MAVNRKRALLASVLLVLSLGLITAVRALSATTTKDFSLSMSASTTTVVQGQSATNTVTVTSLGGFNDAVTLSVSGLPTGVAGKFDPSGSSKKSQRILTLQAQASAPAATATVTVTGTSSGNAGNRAHSATFQLVVAPAYTLSVTNDNLGVDQGGSTSFTIAISRQPGFTASVAFSITGADKTMKTTFIPTSTTGNSVGLQVSTTASTPTGTYSLTVTGKSTVPAQTTVAHLKVSAPNNGGAMPFTISSAALPLLSPGVTRSINLSITNPNKSALQISALTIAITGTSKSTCGTDNFAVHQYGGAYPLPKSVPAGATYTLTQLGVAAANLPSITMINKPINQDACKSATVNLSYSGAGSGN